MRRPKDIRRKLWRRVAGKLVQNPPTDLDRTVLLAGSGRSGTTWVAELINAAHDHRVIFEPFDARFNEDWPVTRRFAPPGTDDPVLEAAARQALDGTLSNRWVDAHNTAIRPQYRLVKAIRANLALGWMGERFPELRIVFLMRHPLAVARSRQQMGWGPALDQLLAQDALLAFLGDRAAPLHREQDPFLQHVLLWCVENAVALAHLPAGAHTVYYERLCTEPVAEARALFAALHRPVPANLEEAVSRPSQLARDHSAVLLGARPVDAWAGKIDAATVDAAMRYLTLFGLDTVYGPDPQPRV